MVGTNGARLLRLTARYADAWNTTWITDVAELVPLLGALDAACAEVGRDPKTLERSACVHLDMPDRVGRFPYGDFVPPPARTASENAEALRAYARAGLSHVMVWLDPCTPAGVAAFRQTLGELDGS